MNGLKQADYDYGGAAARRFHLWIKKLSGAEADKKELYEAESHLRSLKRYYPQRHQRMKGMADGLGIQVKTLQAWSLRAAKRFKAACTDSFCAPPATADGEIYLSWNMDVLSAVTWLRYMPVFLHDPPGGYRYVAFGIPCFMGLGLMNKHGLSYVATVVGMSDGGGDGLFDYELNNLCMESCEDVSGVREKYETTPKYTFSAYGAGIFMNLNCIWADAGGNGVAIEHSANHIDFHPAENGILAIANHHQFLSRNLTGSPDPDRQPAIAGSYCRLGRMWNLLRENHGKVGLDTLIRFASDHETELEHISDYSYREPVDDATICVHYWNIADYFKKGRLKDAYEAFIMGKTLMAFIIQPKTFTVWRCGGNPCAGPFVPLRFGEALHGGATAGLPVMVRFNTGLHGSVLSIRFYRTALNFIYEKLIRKIIKFMFNFLEKIVPVRVEVSGPAEEKKTKETE